MAYNLLSPNPSNIEFLFIGLPIQLSKISNSVLYVASDTSISSVPTAHNLGVVFDSNMSMSGRISALCKSSCLHVRDLR